MRSLCSLALAFALVGCAAPRAAAPMSAQETVAPASPDAARAEPAVATSDDFARLLGEEQALDGALLGAVDCAAVCRHLGALCELSERICALSLEEPDAELEARCSDGRARCTRARERTASCRCQ